MRNIKLIVEYDGTDFSGWQFQPGLRTVQRTIEEALERVTNRKVTLCAAGRTDSGVHAANQVANFHTDSPLPVRSILMGGNTNLPRDVAIKSATDVDPGFHSRFGAVSRTYLYQMSLRPLALGRRYYWRYPYELDAEAIRQAARHLLGEQDFKSFCNAKSELEHHRCNVSLAEWTDSSDMPRFTITANRFVHGMVRIIMGTLVLVGRGKLDADDIPRMLAAGDRRVSGPTAPARGLILQSVAYA